MKLSVLALLTMVLLGSAGCVSQQQADDLKEANRALKEQLAACQAHGQQLEASLSELHNYQGAKGTQLTALMTERDTLKGQVASLMTENEALAAKYRQALLTGNRLPEELENELKAFADRQGAMADFDAATGSVRLSSDLTFGLGKAELSPAAAAAIPSLAEVLNSDLARNYEVRIVGHTDSVPMKNPATIREHKSNWGLSVHRAIAVRDALAKAGVADVRTAVSGHSMYRPVVANQPRGAQANRRVEIYLAPMAPVDESLLTPAAAGGSTATDSGASSDGDGDGPGPGEMIYK